MDPTSIGTPVRLILGTHHLVPPASSLALTAFVPTDVVTAETGQVGLLVGADGPEVVYPATSDWIEAHRPVRSGPPRERADAA